MTSNDIEIDLGEDETARIVCDAIRGAYFEYAKMCVIALAWLCILTATMVFLYKAHNRNVEKARAADKCGEAATLAIGGGSR